MTREQTSRSLWPSGTRSKSIKGAWREATIERGMIGRVGILGGSGLYELSALENSREEILATPFGEPSDAYRMGELGGRPVAFLARHGRGHRLAPSQINYRANMFGFKLLGCDAVLSVAAVGSLREEMPPSHVCIPS